MAKNPDERYQNGAEFAEDLRQLEAQGKSGSTTTSLRTAGSGETKSRLAPTGSATALNVPPAAVVAQAQKVAQHLFFNAPLKDLILGAATVVLLVILAAQSKLLVSTPKTATITSDAAVSSPPVASVVPTKVSSEPAQPLQPQSAPVHTPAVKKVAAKTARPAKQIVVPSSTLDLSVQHQFKDATLYVWVDEQLLLTRALHGGAQKKLVVFNGVRGVDSESLKIPAGQHLLRFRALSADQTVDLSKTVSAEFIGGDTKSLQLTFDKHNSTIHLNWQ